MPRLICTFYYKTISKHLIIQKFWFYLHKHSVALDKNGKWAPTKLASPVPGRPMPFEKFPDFFETQCWQPCLWSLVSNWLAMLKLKKTTKSFIISTSPPLLCLAKINCFWFFCVGGTLGLRPTYIICKSFLEWFSQHINS